jgi:phage-related protein
LPSLDDVTQRFIADVAGYVGPLREAAAAARDLRDATIEGAPAADVDAHAIGDLRDKAEEGAEAMKSMRDASVEDDVALDGVRDRAEETASALSRLRDKAGEAAASMLGLSAASDAAAGSEDAGEGMGGMVYMIGALIVAIAGVLPAVAAMGLSIGAFAGFAVPTVEKVWKAISGGKQAIDALPAPLREVANGFKNLEGEYTKLAKAFQVPVAHLLGQVLDIATTMLPRLIPLADAGAKAMGAFLSIVGKGLESRGFTDFLALMAKLAVPATIAVTHLAGALLGFLGNAIKQLAPLSVPFTNFLTDTVKGLSGPLVAALKLGATLLVGLGKALAPILPLLSQFASVLLNDVGSSFMALVPLLTTVAKDLMPALHAAIKVVEPILANMLTPNSPLLSAIAALLKMLPTLIGIFTHFLDFLAANPAFARTAVDVLSALAAIVLITKAISILGTVIDFLFSPEIAVAIAIGLIVVGLIELYKHSKLVRDVLADLASFFKGVWQSALHAAGDIIKWFISGPLAAIKSAIADLAAWWKTHGQAMAEVASEVWKTISTIIKIWWDLTVAVIKVGMAVLEDIWGVAWAIIKGVTKTVWNLIKIIVDSTFHEVLDIVGFILDILTGHWHQAWEDLKALVSTVLHETVGIIQTILSGLISIMINAGKAAVEGFIHGVTSMIGAVGNAFSGIAHEAASWLGLSPAEQGPLSGGGAPEVRGRHFAQSLAQGILEGRSSVSAALASLSGVMSAGTHPGALAGSSGTSGLHINVPITLAPGMGSLVSPQFLNGLMPVVQEAILRYTQLNQSNGVAGFNRRS